MLDHPNSDNRISLGGKPIKVKPNTPATDIADMFKR
jgi:hypothetical protein